MTEEATSPRTRRILLITGLGAGVLLAAVLIYTVFVSPQRQPYRDALAQYEQVSVSNDRLSIAGNNLKANDPTVDDTAFADRINTAQAAMRSIETENTALGKSAVLQDGKGKELYNSFNTILAQYLTYNNRVIDSIAWLRPILNRCSIAMGHIEETTAGVQSVQACADELRSLKSIPDEDYQALAVALAGSYEKQASILAQVVALPDPKGAQAAQRATLLQNLNDAVTNTEITTTFQKNLAIHRQAVLPVDAGRALETYLRDKSRIFW